jgi:hypothetical protein
LTIDVIFAIVWCMSNEHLQEEPLTFEQEMDAKRLHDPTGLLSEIPEDPNLLSWLQIAYLVKKALEEEPDEVTHQHQDYILNSQPVIEIAISRLIEDRKHQNLNPPPSK